MSTRQPAERAAHVAERARLAGRVIRADLPPMPSSAERFALPVQLLVGLEDFLGRQLRRERRVVNEAEHPARDEAGPRGGHARARRPVLSKNHRKASRSSDGHPTRPERRAPAVTQKR